MPNQTVAVIGLGNMGAALARAMLRSGLAVTVWNRTASKSHALTAEGAQVASTSRDAAESADVVVVCVAEHAMTSELLEGAELAGRVVVQLTAGTAQQSRDLAEQLSQRGARLLEGQVGVYPDVVGTPRSRVLYAGDRAAFDEARAVTDSFAGAVYLGPRIGAVSGLAAALRTYYVSTSVTTVLALEVSRRHGVAVAAALEEIDLQHPIVLEGVRSSFTDDGPRESDSDRVTIERYAAGAAALAGIARGCGLDPATLGVAARVLDRAVELGHGAAGIGAVALALEADAPE